MTDEPAALTWKAALAPRPRHTTNGRHWWRDHVTDAFQAADHAWWLRREAAAMGYRTEMADFERDNPRPRFGDFLRHLSAGSWDLHDLELGAPDGSA